MNLNIVLVEPEIPQNTGNIARTCAATGSTLHLIKPFGFEINDKYLKRAGLDYWDKLNIQEYQNLVEFLNKFPPEKNNMFFVTTKGKKIYTEIQYSNFNTIFLLFGKETKGLPEDLLKKYLSKTIRIPMRENIRSLNLANSVGIITYELLKQNDFDGLKTASEYFNK